MKNNKIKIVDPKIEYIECDCHTEFIQCQYWKEDDLLFLSMYEYGKARNREYSFKERLRQIWCIIKNGHCWKDEVTLNKQERIKLMKYLEKIN